MVAKSFANTVGALEKLGRVVFWERVEAICTITPALTLQEATQQNECLGSMYIVTMMTAYSTLLSVKLTSGGHLLKYYSYNVWAVVKERLAFMPQ